MSLRIGESQQLRGPVGEIERWTSDHAEIVSVSDEDIVSGRVGGLIVARSVGRARISAIGFDGTRLVEVDVAVAGVPTVGVSVGESVPLPTVEGVWESDRPRVAIITDSVVRGISPGIAMATVRGGVGRASQACRVEVGGTLESEMNASLDLSANFSVPVRSWRTSTSSVRVSEAGTLVTGDRPRTVQVIAEIGDGSTFSFDLRVMQRAAATPGPDRAAPFPAERRDVITQPPVEEVQGEEVRAHLQRAETAAREQNWVAADLEIRAADLAAAGYEFLVERVRRFDQDFRNRIYAQASAGFTRAVHALANGKFEQMGRELASTPMRREWRPLAESLGSLAGEMQRSETSNGQADEFAPRIQTRLEEAWIAAAATDHYAPLAGLARIAVDRGDDRLAPTIIDTLIGDRIGPSCPAPVREEIELSLRQLGATPLNEVLIRLAAQATGEVNSRSLVSLLAGLSLTSHGRLLIQFHRHLDPAGQRLLVSRLAALEQISCSALFELLTAVLQSLPPDPRLAKALQSEVGCEQIERHAVKWATRGHKGAIIVLRRMYDYPSTVFPSE